MLFLAYLGNRRPTPNQTPHDFMVAVDETLHDQIKIIEDPYQDQFWHGMEDLKRLKSAVKAWIEETSTATRRAVSEKAGHPSPQPWMQGMYEQELHQNKLYRTYMQLEQVLDILIAKNGWLVYSGD